MKYSNQEIIQESYILPGDVLFSAFCDGVPDAALEASLLAVRGIVRE